MEILVYNLFFQPNHSLIFENLNVYFIKTAEDTVYGNIALSVQK